MNEIIDQINRAFEEEDAEGVGALLEAHPKLKARINKPIAAFDAPVITCVRSPKMLDVLLAAGADINARSRWWAGGFGLLDTAEPELAAYAIKRGAKVDAHAAARLNLLDRLRELISAKPRLVHARGGDGQTPLHFAGNVEIAAYLLDNGADINARDVDHESTPAQHMVRDRQPVARYLVERKCETDILLASALGDLPLVRTHLDAEPECVRTRVNDRYFPKSKCKSGGTIYQWTLGFHVSPHEVARQFRHEDVFQLLMDRSPNDVKLLASCWLGDEPTVNTLLEQNPGLLESVTEMDRRQTADAARNNNLPAVRLMLAAGLPLEAIGQHGATPLHWAAFHGNAEMVRLLLRDKPSLARLDADFKNNPLGWAIHGSENGWHHKTGDYSATVEMLLEAGAVPPGKLAGTNTVKEQLRRYGVKD